MNLSAPWATWLGLADRVSDPAGHVDSAPWAKRQSL